MKKLNIALLLLVLCLIFTSCGGKVPNGNGSTQLTPSDTRTVSVPEFDKPSPQPETQPIVTKSISFLGCGDNIVYLGTVRDAARQAVAGGRKYNFKPIYSDVADMIEKADISFINQETLMCGEGYDFSYYPTFNGPQDMGFDLTELGFDIVNIANNHMLDKGGKGLEKTIEFWKKQPVTLIGGYTDKADCDNIRVYEEQGIKIALLSYTYSTNGISASKNSNVYIPYLDTADIKGDVEKAKAKGDLVFVSVHWGQEGSMKPSTEQKNYAKLFADSGVDAIIGHHPHVIQPVEWIEGKDGNKTLCVYSLGNYMAEQAYDYNMVGGMISFDIRAVGDKKPYLENVKFIPTVYDFDPGTFYNNHIYLLENYTEDMAKNHGIKSYGRTTSLAKLRKYVSDTIADEFLPESYKASLS